MPRGRLTLVALLGAVALAAPGTARAHLRTGKVAVDYRADVSPLEPPLSGAVAVRIYRSDLAVRLSSRGRDEIVVLGYLGEPMLRIQPAGVEVASTSPTAAGAGLLKGTRVAAHGWRFLTRAQTVVWHDARLRGLPRGVERRRWTIPLVLDGQRLRLDGAIWRARAPPLWPGAVVGAVFLALTALLLAPRRKPLLRTATVALGTTAAGATLITAIGFAASSTASQGRWIEAGDEIVFVLVGLAVVVRGSRIARALAGGALGLLGLAVGLTKLPVLLHGVVLSALPSLAARSAVVLAISAGAAATILGLVVFFEILEQYDEPARLRSGL